jgi:hypothetical protein
MNPPTLRFTAANQIPFLVRLVATGDHYGMEMRLVNREEPMVEFYDARNPFAYDFVGSKADAIAAGAPVLGQFTGGRYYLSTLRETRHHHGGLALTGGIPTWTLDPASMAAVHAWLDTVAPGVPAIIARNDEAWLRYARANGLSEDESRPFLNGDPDNNGAGAWSDE